MPQPLFDPPPVVESPDATRGERFRRVVHSVAGLSVWPLVPAVLLGMAFPVTEPVAAIAVMIWALSNGLDMMLDPWAHIGWMSATGSPIETRLRGLLIFGIGVAVAWGLAVEAVALLRAS